MSKTILLLLAFASIATAQESAPQFRSTQVSPGIYMIDGVGGFVGGNVTLLVGDEYIVLVDDVMASTISKLVDEVSALAGRPIDFVVNTHVHGDHVGGNELVAKNGAIVVAHDNVRSRMLSVPDLNLGLASLPVISFSDEMTFSVNGHDAYVFHIDRAHTDGDAAILFRQANVISTGDVMFHKLFPFIDLDNGGSVTGYIAGMEKLLDMANDETIIIPGHGPVASKSDLAADKAMLIDARARVKALLDNGMSAADVLDANPLSVYERYSWSFITTERMTQTIIRSLSPDD